MNVSPKHLVRLRQNRGWSQEKLAAVAGVSERTIQRAEKDGSCSLDTKMALASAFEVTPSDLVENIEEINSEDVKYVTSLGGVAGLFVLGLTAPILVLLTGQSGLWEAASFVIVMGFTIVLSLIKYGARSTYTIFDNSSWIVRHPTYVVGLNMSVVQAKSIIDYAYTSGVIATIVTGLTLAVHAPKMLDSPYEYLMLVVRPLFYAFLFVELWFRPYKHKMESMLIKQNGGGIVVKT